MAGISGEPGWPHPGAFNPARTATDAGLSTYEA